MCVYCYCYSPVIFSFVPARLGLLYCNRVFMFITFSFLYLRGMGVHIWTSVSEQPHHSSPIAFAGVNYLGKDHRGWFTGAHHHLLASLRHEGKGLFARIFHSHSVSGYFPREGGAFISCGFAFLFHCIANLFFCSLSRGRWHLSSGYSSRPPTFIRPSVCGCRIPPYICRLRPFYYLLLFDIVYFNR